ncbi:hypothetical protein Sjap_023819 [Stephania japonica]|uniref:Uncharacterized protein n=1 Tax=Stephania japonica TaxID=461633 RepID=A0AAP0HN37_9MAGN
MVWLKAQHSYNDNGTGFIIWTFYGDGIKNISGSPCSMQAFEFGRAHVVRPKGKHKSQ